MTTGKGSRAPWSNAENNFREKIVSEANVSRSQKLAPLKNIPHHLGELLCQQRRNGIADLMVLLGAPTLEKIVVRESLNPCPSIRSFCDLLLLSSCLFILHIQRSCL
jgi:hypothetical protein